MVEFGGSNSGEHGDGQSRGELLPRMFGPEPVEAFGRLKAVFDPLNRMNPGKVVAPYQLDAPYRLDENLRLGADWAPYDPHDLHFRFPADRGSFARAANRCVGVGKCRQPTTEGGAVMCPSFQVTGEEEHSTRGQARLLFEMLDGHGDSAIRDGWRSREVRDALDLCLACKGCKRDCPADVDMATYKAEFLAHHFAGRPWRRPRSDLSMGRLPAVAHAEGRARLGRAANALTHAPLLSRAAVAVAGIEDREVPLFAAETLRQWFARRERYGHLDVSRACAERVLLPPLREADEATVVLADGFSCRTQIHELDSGGHEAVHLAELLATGLPPTPGRPERQPGSAYGVAPGARPDPPGHLAKSLALTGTGLAAAGAATVLGRGFRRASCSAQAEQHDRGRRAHQTDRLPGGHPLVQQGQAEDGGNGRVQRGQDDHHGQHLPLGRPQVQHQRERRARPDRDRLPPRLRRLTEPPGTPRRLGSSSTTAAGRPATTGHTPLPAPAWAGPRYCTATPRPAITPSAVARPVSGPLGPLPPDTSHSAGTVTQMPSHATGAGRSPSSTTRHRTGQRDPGDSAHRHHHGHAAPAQPPG